MKLILSVGSIKHPLTGIGRYTYELAKQLQLQSDLELLLFANSSFLPSLPSLPSLPMQEKNRISILGGVRTHALKSTAATKLYQFLSSIRNRFALKGHDDFVFHGPDFYLPRFDGNSVATFHDLSIFTWAHFHPLERVRYMQRELNLTLQRASLLITDSEFIRQEVSSYFGYPMDKIRTVPLACSSDFHPRVAIETSPVLNKLGLTHGGYTFYAGTIEPRKNIESLLDAYAMLPDTLKFRWPLVLAGHHGWKSENLHVRIEAAVRAGWAHYLGYVTNEELPILFAGARLFVFPSHYEGFGLPVLEAMSSGVPVICSNSSSLPEVAGGSALMFDAGDVDKLNQFIVIGLEDKSWRSGAIDKGLNQSSKYSWERCARETMAVYRELTVRSVTVD